MKKKTMTQAALWIATLALTGRLVYAAIHHHMPVLDTATIAVVASYGFKASIENIATSVRRARSGATR